MDDTVNGIFELVNPANFIHKPMKQLLIVTPAITSSNNWNLHPELFYGEVMKKKGTQVMRVDYNKIHTVEDFAQSADHILHFPDFSSMDLSITIHALIQEMTVEKLNKEEVTVRLKRMLEHNYIPKILGHVMSDTYRISKEQANSLMHIGNSWLVSYRGNFTNDEKYFLKDPAFK